MASDLSSSENICDDEKEEGELSLDDISSSEEGPIYNKYRTKIYGQCPFCLSTNLCATWCSSLTVNKKNNPRERKNKSEVPCHIIAKDLGQHGKENWGNQHYLKDIPAILHDKKKKKDGKAGSIHDLVPISSDSELDDGELEERNHQRKEKSIKVKRKHRKKSSSPFMSPVSQGLVKSLKDKLKKLNRIEQGTSSKKEGSGYSKHHSSEPKSTKSLPVSKKRSKSPPTTRSRTKTKPNAVSSSFNNSSSEKKRKLSPKKSAAKNDVTDPQESPMSQKVTKLLKKVRQLEPYSSRLVEKRSLKDKLSNIIKNKNESSDTQVADVQIIVKEESKSDPLDDSVVQSLMKHALETTDDSINVNNENTTVIDNKSSEIPKAVSSSDVVAFSDSKNLTQPEEIKTEAPERLPSPILPPTPSPKLPSKPSSPLPSTPLSISPTPQNEVPKLPNFCIDEDDEDLELRMIALRSAVIKKHQTRTKKKRQSQQKTPIPQLESPFRNEFEKEFPLLAEICSSPDSMKGSKGDIFSSEDMELDSDMEVDDRESPYSPTDNIGEMNIEKEPPKKVNQSFYSPSVPTETPLFKTFRNPVKQSGLEGSFLELANHECRPYSPTDTPYYDSDLPNLHAVNKPVAEQSLPVPPIGVYPSAQPYMISCQTDSFGKPMPVTMPIPMQMPIIQSTAVAGFPGLYPPTIIPTYPNISATIPNSMTHPMPVDLGVPVQPLELIKHNLNSDLDIEETDLDGSPLVPMNDTTRATKLWQSDLYLNEIQDKTKITIENHKGNHGNFYESQNSLNGSVEAKSLFETMKRPSRTDHVFEQATDQRFTKESLTSSKNVGKITIKPLDRKTLAANSDLIKKKRKRSKSSVIDIQTINSIKQEIKKFSTNEENNKINESSKNTIDEDEEELRKQLLASLAKKMKNQDSIKSSTSKLKSSKLQVMNTNETSKNDEPKVIRTNDLAEEKVLESYPAPVSTRIKQVKRKLDSSDEESIKKTKNLEITSMDLIGSEKEVQNIIENEKRPESPDAINSQRIVINLNEDSLSETETDESKSSSLKVRRELAIPSSEFEKSIDQFLKNLRKQSEKPDMPEENSDESSVVLKLSSSTENINTEKTISLNNGHSELGNNASCQSLDTAALITKNPNIKTTNDPTPLTGKTLKKKNTYTVSLGVPVAETKVSPKSTKNFTVSPGAATAEAGVSIKQMYTPPNGKTQAETVTTSKLKNVFTASLGPPVAEIGVISRPGSSTGGTDKTKSSAPKLKPSAISKTVMQQPAEVTQRILDHLPASQQEEYLRLKLQILEREKKLQKAKESNTPSNTQPTSSIITSPIPPAKTSNRPEMEFASLDLNQNSDQTRSTEATNNIKMEMIDDSISEKNEILKKSSTPMKKIICRQLKRKITNSSSVNKKKNSHRPKPIAVNILSPEVSNSDLVIPKAEKNDLPEANDNPIQSNVETLEATESIPNSNCKSTWEDFKKLVNHEVQTLTDLSIEDKKKLLSKTEEDLVTKRHLVLDDITEMSSNLRQWEVERDLQNIISLEIKNLQEQLKIAEEKLQRQKQKMNVIQPKVSMFHEKINDGRKECFRLSKICSSLGSKVIGPNYKAPAAAAELLNNKIKEVAIHTQKLRNKKVFNKKSIPLNSKKNNKKIKIISKKNVNENYTCDLNKSTHKKLNSNAGKNCMTFDNQSNMITCKTISVLSPDLINSKIEQQLNNLPNNSENHKISNTNEIKKTLDIGNNSQKSLSLNNISEDAENKELNNLNDAIHTNLVGNKDKSMSVDNEKSSVICLNMKNTGNKSMCEKELTSNKIIISDTENNPENEHENSENIVQSSNNLESEKIINSNFFKNYLELENKKQFVQPIISNSTLPQIKINKHNLGNNFKNLNDSNTVQIEHANDSSVQILETTGSYNTESIKSAQKGINGPTMSADMSVEIIETVKIPETEQSRTNNQNESTSINAEPSFLDLNNETEIDTPSVQSNFKDTKTKESLLKDTTSVIGTDFITSTPNKNTTDKTNNNNPQVNTVNLNSEKTIISKPANTMMGIKEKILHAENILSEMLKLSNKNSANFNENRTSSCATFNDCLILNEKNLISKETDKSEKSINQNKTPKISIQKPSSENKTVNLQLNTENVNTKFKNSKNLTNVDLPVASQTNPSLKSVTIRKDMDSDENFENTCIELSRNSENSTFFEEIALLELASAQEVPNKITYKSDKQKSVVLQKHVENLSEDIVKIDFPQQKSSEEINKPNEVILNNTPKNVSHIKINLPKDCQVKNPCYQTRSASKRLSKRIQEKLSLKAQNFKLNNISGTSKTVSSLRKKKKKFSLEKIMDPVTPNPKKFIEPYQSVLTHLNTPRYSKANGILCPFQLRGICKDEDCQFVHQSSYH